MAVFHLDFRNHVAGFVVMGECTAFAVATFGIWRDLPVSALWPQVAVLLGIGTMLFLIARRIARRWEFA